MEANFGVREFIPAFPTLLPSFVGLVSGDEIGQRKKEDKESGDESPHSKGEELLNKCGGELLIVDVQWQPFDTALVGL